MNLTPKTRKRAYEAGLAGIGVAVVYGLVDGEQALTLETTLRTLAK